MVLALPRRKVQINVQLPPDMVETLDNIKANLGSSRNFIIQKALELYLSNDLEIRERAKSRK